MSHTGRVLHEEDSPGLIRIVTDGQIIINENGKNKLIFRIPENELFAFFSGKQWKRGNLVTINVWKDLDFCLQYLIKNSGVSEDDDVANNLNYLKQADFARTPVNDLEVKIQDLAKDNTFKNNINRKFYASDLEALPEVHPLFEFLSGLPVDAVKNSELHKDMSLNQQISIGNDTFFIHEIEFKTDGEIKNISNLGEKLLYFDPCDDMVEYHKMDTVDKLPLKAG